MQHLAFYQELYDHYYDIEVCRRWAAMSLSKECQEFHLTPRGWVEGSFKGDVLGGTKDVAIPIDRVLTISCYDERTTIFSKPFYYDHVDWEADDKEAIRELKKKFGEKPDWFGYILMKKMKN